MPDDVTFQATTPATPAAGITVAADDVSGIKYQRVKLDVGGDGLSVPVTNAAPLPIGTLAGGSISAQGYVAAGVLAAGNPLQMGAVGSTGTIAAQGDGSIVRLWADVNGRLQIRGTIDSIPNITITGGTVGLAGGTGQVLGSVQTVGTNQVLGTLQPLAGSVHIANTAAVLGSVSAQGYSAHDGAMTGNPLLLAAYGSSGTQAAAHDGSITRLWADLNGRLQVRGTIDSLPNVTITGGTVGIAGGTLQALGSIQLVGTNQALGTIQPLAGSVHVANTAAVLGTASIQGLTAYLSGGGSANPIIGGGVSLAARPGTSTIGSVVRDWYDLHGRPVVQVGNGTTDLLGTAYTASGNGTIITGRGAGSYIRIYDMVVSGSAAGTVRIMEDGTVRWGPLFLAANGGWNMNSAIGVKLPNVNTSLVMSQSMGSLSITIHYGVEGA